MSDAIVPIDGFNPFDNEETRPSKVYTAEDLERFVRGDCDETCEPNLFPHADGHFEVSRKGIFDVRDNKDGKEGKRTRICDELRIVGGTRDANGGNWGKRLEWRDADSIAHTWAMPMAMLQGDASEVLRELLSGGLRIVHGQHLRLREYLQTVEADARVRCVDRLGWQGPVYVTPTETIGNTAGERTMFQGTALVNSGYSQKGTPETWRNNIAALASGNSRLVFALCCAFAGPLLLVAGVESGGFHFVGASSSGKTTALGLAATVWGAPTNFVKTWRATANGLESVAAVHNDNVLILDELGQCDPKQAGEVLYMLANGKGKARASRTGGARSLAEWNLLFLSSGEVRLETLMDAERKKANAGQVVRMASIPMDAGQGLGGFEDLHSSESAGAFAQRLARAAETDNGAVGLEWVRRIVPLVSEVRRVIADGLDDFVKEVVPLGASGQVARVARRFGVVAAAGELATAWGLTGWNEGEADAAAKACFGAWLEDFGIGLHEDATTCEQVRLFLEAHGASRFQDTCAEAPFVANRAGFWRKGENGTREYLVLPEIFKNEVLKGRDLKQGIKALEKAGILLRGPDRVQIKVRPVGLEPMWVYRLVLPEEVVA